jgi:hypothetical protein
MGLEWSVFNVMGNALEDEVVTETTESDGRTVKKTKKKNPWVTGAVVVSSSLFLLAYIDGGKGMVSHTFGRKCISCNKGLLK